MFKRTEAADRPRDVEPLKYGKVRVNRNVTTETRDGATVYVYETAIMTEAAYAAYVGAQEAEARREAAVIDDYTLALIEEGVL